MMVRLFLALEDSELLCDLCLDPPVRLRGILCVLQLFFCRFHPFSSTTHTPLNAHPPRPPAALPRALPAFVHFA
jgi:hypothetical protein